MYTDPRIFDLAGAVAKLPMTFSAKPNPVSEIVQATGTDDKTAQMEPIEGRSESVSSAQAETGVSLAGTGEQNESNPSRQPPQNSGDRRRRAGTGGNGGKRAGDGARTHNSQLGRLEESNSKGRKNQVLTVSSASACTNACTGNADEHFGAAIDADFGETLKMIALLPLTKAEKAEAVRRLLASNGGRK